MEAAPKKLTRLARAQAIEVLESVLVAAKAGDMSAAKLVLDRIWPMPRGGAVSLPLRATRSVADVRDAMHELLGRMASGDITPQDGQTFITVMKDIVMVHTAETLPFSGPPLEITDARQSFTERIQKAMAARQRHATIDVSPEPDAGA